MVGQAVGRANDSAITYRALGASPAIARLVLAAEIRLYREGLSQALASESAIEVLATPGNCAELLACLKEVDPHVVVVDTGMTGWISVARSLRKQAGPTRLVALGVRGVPEEVVTLAEAGVAGYVTREESLERLVEVVLSVARGEMPCSPEVSWHLMRRVASLSANTPDAALARLTMREHEILRLIEHGLSNKEIACGLMIQLATVKNHVRSILGKLEVQSRGEAAAVARMRG